RFQTPLPAPFVNVAAPPWRTSAAVTRATLIPIRMCLLERRGSEKLDIMYAFSRDIRGRSVTRPRALLVVIILTTALTGQLQILDFCSFVFAVESYTYVQLTLPSAWVFYDARELSADGRAGGYVRLSNDILPIDAPIVWDKNGFYGILPIANLYRQAYVQ